MTDPIKKFLKISDLCKCLGVNIGEKFNYENITTKRPGRLRGPTGVVPSY